MIQRVTLRDFMAFERFRLDIRGDAYLAGPNNAGKSTLITAIRIAACEARRISASWVTL